MLDAVTAVDDDGCCGDVGADDGLDGISAVGESAAFGIDDGPRGLRDRRVDEASPDCAEQHRNYSRRLVNTIDALYNEYVRFLISCVMLSIVNTESVINDYLMTTLVDRVEEK